MEQTAAPERIPIFCQQGQHNLLARIDTAIDLFKVFSSENVNFTNTGLDNYDKTISSI